MTVLSVILPTRRRTAQLRRLLESLRERTANPEALEVILVIDQDDRESQEFEWSGLRLEKAVVNPGSTMGQLHRAGYHASHGRYLLLMNDDVVVQTAGWDVQLRRAMDAYPDGIVLAHANDQIFRETLSTFPVLTRKFCELAGGICPADYRRYRIDDHLHHIFDLIQILGYTRRVYLPEVVFRHGAGAAYVPDAALVDLDHASFESLMEQRRAIALSCVERIEDGVLRNDSKARDSLLRAFPDSLALRGRHQPRWWCAADPTAGGRVTVAVIAASAHVAAGALEALQAVSADVPSMVVPSGNHALTTARCDYLVLAGASIRAVPGWIETGLRTIAAGAAIAVADGALLLDLPRCANLRLDEAHSDPLRAFAESAEASGLAVGNWPVRLGRVDPIPAIPRPLPMHSPEQSPKPTWQARIVNRTWSALATLGARAPVLPNPGAIPPAFFDAAWYRARYPKIASGDNPLLHYLQRGGFEGYDPNPDFDSAWYLANNPDVAASGLNPLVHFVHYGAREGRSHSLGRPKPAVRTETVQVSGPVPLSVVIPTRNRADTLVRMLEACRRHTGGATLEFLVIDDGSTDGTPEVLRELAPALPNLRWQSVPHGGPGAARNLAAGMARYDVLLFTGDDILPAADTFFRSHAALQGANPQIDYALLGRVEWPSAADFAVTFAMRCIERDGSQFAFSRLMPGSLAGWQFFYTANVSLKKARIADWTAAGFDTQFPGAAFEDIELGYRLWHSSPGLRLHYEPSALACHHHPYTVAQFFERQFFAGKSLRRLLELHPELSAEYGVDRIDDALRQAAHTPASIGPPAEAIETLSACARLLEARGALGTETWHAPFLSALFELFLHHGYASAVSPTASHLEAARAVILHRFRFRMRAVKGWHDSGLLPFANHR